MNKQLKTLRTKWYFFENVTWLATFLLGLVLADLFNDTTKIPVIIALVAVVIMINANEAQNETKYKIEALEKQIRKEKL